VHVQRNDISQAEYDKLGAAFPKLQVAGFSP
jgi:hypothetical protein